MKRKSSIFESKGKWGSAVVYADSVLIRPDLKWTRWKQKVMRHMLRGRRLKEHDFVSFGPRIARELLGLAVRGKWKVGQRIDKQRLLYALTDLGIEHQLLLDTTEVWRVNGSVLWFERTHDGKEKHFTFDMAKSAQYLYDEGEKLALKLWIVDLLAEGNLKFAAGLSRCVSDKVPSTGIVQPMDMFAFWAEDGNIFAHTAFGEKVRLFKPLEANVKTSDGFMYWQDFNKETRKQALSALLNYF